MTPRSSRIILVVLLAIIGSATLLIAAEAAFRYRMARRAGRGVQIRYTAHDRLQRALLRDVDYNGVVHINRFGFRGAEFDSLKTRGTTRIILVGASTTFDPCVGHDRETWAARLEHWLTELAPGHRFQVINAGVPGSPMVDHIVRMETEFKAFEPDVYVVYAGHGIVSADQADGGPARRDLRRVVRPWNKWLRQHSQLYDRLRPQWELDTERDTLSEAQWASALENSSREFQSDLTRFTATARGMGAKVVMAEINRVTGTRPVDQFTATERATWEAFGTPVEVLHAGYHRFHNIWRSVADSLGATFIPADSIQITGPQHYCDAIHFNAAGSEAMGRRLAEQLLASNVLGLENLRN
jgi:hypothetical protein